MCSGDASVLSAITGSANIVVNFVATQYALPVPDLGRGPAPDDQMVQIRGLGPGQIRVAPCKRPPCADASEWLANQLSADIQKSTSGLRTCHFSTRRHVSYEAARAVSQLQRGRLSSFIAPAQAIQAQQASSPLPSNSDVNVHGPACIEVCPYGGPPPVPSSGVRCSSHGSQCLGPPSTSSAGYHRVSASMVRIWSAMS